MGSAITETPGPGQATGKREERIKLWKHHRDSVLHIISCRLEIICKYVLKSKIYLVNNSTYLCIYFTSSLSPNSTTIRIFKRLNIDRDSTTTLCLSSLSNTQTQHTSLIRLPLQALFLLNLLFILHDLGPHEYNKCLLSCYDADGGV